MNNSSIQSNLISLALTATIASLGTATFAQNDNQNDNTGASVQATPAISSADIDSDQTAQAAASAQNTSNTSNSPLSSQINSIVSGANSSTQINGISMSAMDDVRRFYAGRNYQPAWVSNEKPNSLATSFDDLLGQSINHGLNPFSYGYQEISQSIRSLQIAFSNTPRQIAEFDIMLTNAYLQLARDMVKGRTSPRSQFDTWTLGSRSQNIVALLQSNINRGDISQTYNQLQPNYYQYKGMVNALEQLRQIAQQGGWPSVKSWGTIELGQTDGRLSTIREILYIMGDYNPSSQDMLSSTIYDNELLTAVKSFQERHGLATDGVIGKSTFAELNVPVEARINRLEVNMDRWRWLPESLGSRYIMVNIPDFRVKIFENAGNSVVFDSRVVVGRRDRQTPVFSDTMQYVVMNPYWHVPYSIAVKDKLPQLRKDPYAVAKSGFRVFQNGTEIDPGKVNWNNVTEDNFPYQLRQDPGDSNALGSIKFMFPNKHAIYLHDTPSRGLFSRTIRSYSSGCIRVEDYLDFAKYLLPDWSRERIADGTSGGSPNQVNLPSTLPVHLLYFTAWVDESGRPHYRPDIYSKDNSLANKLGV